MPVIQRTEIWFESQKFMRVLKVGADGEFSIELPSAVAMVLGYGIVRADKKDECVRKFDSEVKTYKESQSTKRQVIIYKINTEISFSDGIAIAVCAFEYIETETKMSDGGSLFSYDPMDYEDRLVGIELAPRKIHELHSGHDKKRAACCVERTPERAAFFNKIATAMTRITTELQKLESPETLIELADKGVLLLK